jgi:hypothetical protein
MAKTNLINSSGGRNIADWANNYAFHRRVSSRPDQFKLRTHKMFLPAEEQFNTK